MSRLSLFSFILVIFLGVSPALSGWTNRPDNDTEIDRFATAFDTARQKNLTEFKTRLNPDDDKTRTEALELFEKVLYVIIRDYADNKTPTELVDNAIKGLGTPKTEELPQERLPVSEFLIERALDSMVEKLDPHSRYFSEKEYRDFQIHTRGEFGGLGMTVAKAKGETRVKVVEPLPDTPAARAGIKAGDFLTHIESQSVEDLDLSTVVARLRGRTGTRIKITVVSSDGGTTQDLVLTRELIRLKSVRWKTEGNYGHIAVSNFTEQTDAGIAEAIRQMRRELKDDLRGIVLDLRDNPGGLLVQAVAVSDDFLKRGEIVSARGRAFGDNVSYTARAGDLADGLPIVILQNARSASASEIVAGALQDNRRAIVMGRSSFGKGSIQSLIPLPGHGAIKLTTARYYTPNGRSIQAHGIDPDILLTHLPNEGEDVKEIQREASLPGAFAAPDPNLPVKAPLATIDASQCGVVIILTKRDDELSCALAYLRANNVAGFNTIIERRLPVSNLATTTGLTSTPLSSPSLEGSGSNDPYKDSANRTIPPAP
ncbi:MAG: S41 family peptidase [Alphaproteobacteria bacterium]